MGEKRGREGYRKRNQKNLAREVEYHDAGRADVLKSFNLRLPEPILFQLRYIGEYTPYSMQQFCIEHLTAAIQEKIAELTGER